MSTDTFSRYYEALLKLKIMRKKFWESRKGNALRWIGLFPISLIGAIIVGILAYALSYVQHLFSADDPQWVLITAPIIGTIALFKIAQKIAPSCKKIVFYTLLTLRILATLSLFILYENHYVGIGLLILQEILSYISVYVLYGYFFEK